MLSGGCGRTRVRSAIPGGATSWCCRSCRTGPDRTCETWDFYLETTDLTEAEVEAVRSIDEVLQQQDITIVESAQHGMSTPAFTQGRYVYDPGGSGLSEHGVHHFHGLVLQAYPALCSGSADR